MLLANTFTALYYVPGRLAGSPAPLLLYLHGAGESGSEIRGLISDGATGTPPVELERGTALPALRNKFVMVAPQTSHGWGVPRLDPHECMHMHTVPPQWWT